MACAASSLRPFSRIERAILVIRGQRVILDADLADLYRVETRALIQAVKRNRRRFPDDFMFRVSGTELRRILRSQSVISSSHGGRRTRPYAFTEQGVAMLSSVLRSERAVQTNVAIIRTFVKLRQMLAQHADLARRVDELETRYEGKFADVFEAIRTLVERRALPEPPRRRIGFHREPDPSDASSGAGNAPAAGRPKRRTGRARPQSI
jgi:hypothetical protein